MTCEMDENKPIRFGSLASLISPLALLVSLSSRKWETCKIELLIDVVSKKIISQNMYWKIMRKILFVTVGLL